MKLGVGAKTHAHAHASTNTNTNTSQDKHRPTSSGQVYTYGYVSWPTHNCRLDTCPPSESLWMCLAPGSLEHMMFWKE